MRTIRDVVVSALVLVLTCTAAWAQATAELNGRVTDESGAVLPGVTVTATQTATGFMRTVATDEAGTWSMPNLPIGPYKLDASLQGFRSYSRTGIVLQVSHVRGAPGATGQRDHGVLLHRERAVRPAHAHQSHGEALGR